MPVLAPALRDEFDLTLAQVGLLLAAQWVGTLATLLLWGFAADRSGERLVLLTGLGSCGVLVCAAAYAPGFAWLLVLLTLAGAAGASVNSASGRAVMHWFAPEERGLALGVRQTAIPIGGLVAAVVLPSVGLEAAFLFLGGWCVLGAVVGAAVIREGGGDGAEVEAAEWTLRDGRLWRLCAGSGLYLVAQVALIGFVVLFLHDVRGFSSGEAAAVLAGMQVLAGALRIAVGRWSDRLRTRVVPLRRVGAATALLLALVALLLSAPPVVLVPAFVLAGGLSMAWNGLSFTAAAELAGRARSGAAIGFQQSALSAVGAAAPVAFAAAVAATSWRTAFLLAAACPLAGTAVLRGLRV